MFLPAAVSAITLLRRRVLSSATIPLKTDGILCQAWTKRASGTQAVPWVMQCTYSVVKMATVSIQTQLRNWTEAGPSLPLQLFGKWSTCFLVRLQREYSRLFAFWTVRIYAYSVGRIVTMDCSGMSTYSTQRTERQRKFAIARIRSSSQLMVTSRPRSVKIQSWPSYTKQIVRSWLLWSFKSRLKSLRRSKSGQSGEQLTNF